MRNMKKRLRALVIIAFAALLLAPAAAFAQDAPPPGATGGTLTVEYRFAEGETPDVPAEIQRFGFRYYLVSQSDPVLESTLPNVRTYQYRIEGAVTDEQLADIQGLGEVTLTPVKVIREIEKDIVDVTEMFTNDVDDIENPKSFLVSKGNVDGPDTTEMRPFKLTGVTFDIITWEDGLPYLYEATAVYRGVETESVHGYWMADMLVEAKVNEDINAYIIIAEYETDEMPPPVELFVGLEIPAEEEALSTEDLVLVSAQTGNPFVDIINGDVPLGNISVTGAWSALSMFLSISAIAIAALYAIGFLVRRKRAEMLGDIGTFDEESLELIKKRGNLLRFITIIVAVMTLVIWLYMDDRTTALVWINAFTPMVAILFGITLAMCFITNSRTKIVLHEDEDLTSDSTVA